jgi:beta-lactamase class A
VFGLPARAAAFRPPTLVDRGAQRGLARMGAGRGVVTGVWARNLATGRTASWNAGTPFTAASTLKLAIAIAALAGARGDPVRGPLWPLLVGAVRRSDNAAANALLVRVGGGTRTGGSARVNRVAALLGARRTDMYGGYVLDTRRAAAAADLPPAGADRRLRIPPGKHTTPRDLGLMLAALHAATLGRGPAARLGVSPREARAVLWLLIRADYPGLLAPGTSDPVAHKAGWLRAVQHDAGVVYTRRGALVVVVMTQRAAGVSYAASAVYGARVLRVLRPLR